MIHQLLTGFSKLYFPILLASLFVGVYASNQTIHLAPYSSYFLALIFFLAALKINVSETFAYFKDYRMLVEVNFFMLIGLPIATYYITSLVYPSLATALLLLAAMPSGMTDALFSEIAGGNKSLALVFIVTTSLLAPFTVPLMLKWLAGATVTVGFFEICILLAKVIFIPFLVAGIVKRFYRTYAQRTTDWISPLSMIALSLLIMGVVAKRADIVREALHGGAPLLIVGILFAFFIIIHLLSYFLASWRNHRDRIAVVISATYMNFTLAIYLADKFFIDEHAIAPVVLAVIPWALLLIPFKSVMKHISNPTSATIVSKP